MKTLFVDLTNQFPLNTAGNFVVFREDLMGDIIYELGAELAFMVKEQNLSDKARIITDFATNQPAEYNSLYESIRNNIYNALLGETIPEEVRFIFSEQYVDWLYYNSSPIYSSIGKVLREKNGVITLSPQDMYEEYVKNKVLTGIKDLLTDSDIQKFTIVDLDDGETQIVKDVEQLRGNFQYEDFTGSWVQCELGYAYSVGVGVTKDQAASITFYIQSANKGNSISANWLGWCYQQGNLGVEKDDRKAFEWYKKAARLGNLNGKANLGYCYHVGLGTSEDYKKAEELYSECLDSHPFTNTNLANIYYNGNLGAPDYERAFQLYKKRADLDGDAYSSFQTASMYLNEQGVEKDLSQALEYFLKAEKAGRTDVFINIGDLIHQGYGGNQFTKEDAYSYYKKAISNGINDVEVKIRILDEIKPNQFKGNEHLKRITISDQIMIIPQKAFSGCPNLQTVIIPSSVKVIDKEAFYGCPVLESVIIEGGVENINEKAFANCKNLYQINLGNSLLYVGDEVFKNCERLNEAEFPESLLKIGISCFEDCTKLKKVRLGNHLTELSDCVFRNCKQLNEVNIPEDLVRIGKETFKNCEDLIEIKFPQTNNNENIRIEIDERCFYECIRLEKVFINDSVNTIYDEAFKNCFSLKEFRFPLNIDYLGDAIFENCKSLKSVEFPESKLFYKNLLSKFEVSDPGLEIYSRISKRMFYNCENIESISIPFYCILGYGLNDFAFSGCKSLKEVIIEDVPLDFIKELKSIGEKDVSLYLNGMEPYWDFDNEYPTSYIGNGVFSRCENLTKLTFGNYIYESCKEQNEETNNKGIILSECDNIKILQFPFFNDRKIKKRSYLTGEIENKEKFLIYNCPSLSTIDFTNWKINEKSEYNREFYSLVEYKCNFCKSYDIEDIASIMINLVDPLNKCNITNITINNLLKNALKDFFSSVKASCLSRINIDEKSITIFQNSDLYELHQKTVSMFTKKINETKNLLNYLEENERNLFKILTVSSTSTTTTKKKDIRKPNPKPSLNDDNKAKNKKKEVSQVKNKDGQKVSHKKNTRDHDIPNKLTRAEKEAVKWEKIGQQIYEEIKKEKEQKKKKGFFSKLFGK